MATKHISAHFSIVGEGVGHCPPRLPPHTMSNIKWEKLICRLKSLTQPDMACAVANIENDSSLYASMVHVCTLEASKVFIRTHSRVKTFPPDSQYSQSISAYVFAGQFYEWPSDHVGNCHFMTITQTIHTSLDGVREIKYCAQIYIRTCTKSFNDTVTGLGQAIQKIITNFVTGMQWKHSTVKRTPRTYIQWKLPTPNI